MLLPNTKSSLNNWLILLVAVFGILKRYGKIYTVVVGDIKRNILLPL